jgi:hypothetical protein
MRYGLEKVRRGQTSTLDESEVKLRRKIALERAANECDGCDFVAWSYKLADQLQLRERDDEPDRPHVFCEFCAKRHDERSAKRRRVR